MKRLPLTQSIQDALAAIERAERGFTPGRDSAAIVELPKLALADAVLDAVRARRLAELPLRARPVGATLTRQPKRRRA